MATRAPSADWIREHRARWAAKPGLRAVYHAFFRRMRDACAPGPVVVELGCGPGFFKETYPEILATDVVPNPYADRVIDATVLPFGDGAVDNLLALDVFHHLARPSEFLAEVARVLRPGGRLVMIEPWIGLAGAFIFRYLHHEACDRRVDPFDPWTGGTKNPMEGNAALPYLYFGATGALARLSLPLRVVRREPFAGIAWLLSGGFQAVNLLPRSLVPVADALDRAASLVPATTATRCLLVVERS